MSNKYVLDLAILGVGEKQAELIAGEIADLMDKYHIKEADYAIYTLDDYITMQNLTDEDITIERLIHS